MLTQQLAMVSTAEGVDLAELAIVSAALQKQVVRDFAPVWEIQATVDAFGDLEDVPPGYWPIVVIPEVASGAGVHQDRSGKPFALVEAGPTWSLAASHEALEMLADPSGNRLIAGYSPEPGRERVEFLVEVCDPVQDDTCAYTVNGILVSDFFTPSYFDPDPGAGVRYSFTGAVTQPRQVLPGGYLSWHDPESGDWFQLNRFGAEAELRNLGPQTVANATLRSMIDARTPEVRRLCRLDPMRPSVRYSLASRELVARSSRKLAELWKQQIGALTK